MPTLLHIDSSADLSHSRSRELTAAFAETWRARGDEFTVIRRDLHVDALPHLETAALHWPASARRPDAAVSEASQALLEEIVDELLRADVLLIGAPLYNYSLPSTLKAWIDRVHLPGVLAPAEPGGTQPLAGRPAVVVVSRGGVYDPGTPTADWDHSSPVLDIILGTALGMDVHRITASITLADEAPALAEYSDRARREFDEARSELTRLARELS
jgi:FMN-dependent NADH-azoreductase